MGSLRVLSVSKGIGLFVYVHEVSGGLYTLFRTKKYLFIFSGKRGKIHNEFLLLQEWVRCLCWTVSWTGPHFLLTAHGYRYGEDIMQLEWRGIRVYITREGNTGRGVLLLHGWMCSSDMMEGIQKALAGHMRTAAIDFPGHGLKGQAPAPKEVWGVPDYMELAAEVIRVLNLAPCDIIAHSFGARVAILLAATYPELVGRMVLTGAAGLRREKTRKENARQKIYRLLKNGVNAAEKVKLFGDLPGRWQEALIQRFGSPDYRALSPQMRKTFNQIVTQDLAEELPLIQASTILFWGENDTETPLWMGRKMEEMIPDAALIVEEGAGHFAYLEKSAVFESVVKSFLLEGRDL